MNVHQEHFNNIIQSTIAEIESGDRGLFIEPPTQEEIREFRESQGLSQAEFAERIGTTTETVRDWEQE